MEVYVYQRDRCDWVADGHRHWHHILTPPREMCQDKLRTAFSGGRVTGIAKKTLLLQRFNGYG